VSILGYTHHTELGNLLFGLLAGTVVPLTRFLYPREAIPEMASSLNAYQHADDLLDLLEQPSTGTAEAATGESRVRDRKWMVSCIIRAMRKLLAAEYHRENIDSRVQHLRRQVELYVRTEEPAIAFELDAFLAASRSCIDFIGGMLAVYERMDRRTSITALLKKAEKDSTFIFSDLLNRWREWIEFVQKYRDECVHYRTLELTGGYRTGPEVMVFAVLVPKKLPEHDKPSTRGRLVNLEVLADIHESVGIAGIPPYDVPPYEKFATSNHAKELTELLNELKREREACQPVEEFCGEHLEKLHQFVSEALREVKALAPSSRVGPGSTPGVKEK
jgi:hypothetical protein